MNEQRKSICRAGLVLGIIMVLATSGLDARGSGTPEADEAALRSMIARASDAWGQGDAQVLAATWSEDGELVTGDGSFHSGRPEIEKYLARLFAGRWKGSRFVATVTSVRFPRPEVALMHLDAALLRAGETEPAPENRAVQSAVAVREAGSWRLTLYQSTRIRPPGPPPSTSPPG